MSEVVVYPSDIALINRLLPFSYSLDVGGMGFFRLSTETGKWVQDYSPCQVAADPLVIVEGAVTHLRERFYPCSKR